MPPTKKADAATVRARIDEVLRIRLDGAQFHEIQQYSAEKGWGGEPGKPLSERQIREYMGRTDKLLLGRNEKRRRKLLAMHLARRESLYARCVNGADYGTALRVLADTAKLQDLYAAAADVKELMRLFAAQGEQLRKLEAALNANRERTEDGAQRPCQEIGPGGEGSPATSSG